MDCHKDNLYLKKIFETVHFTFLLKCNIYIAFYNLCLTNKLSKVIMIDLTLFIDILY